MIRRHFTRLNIVYGVCLSLTTLIIFGFLPREVSLFVAFLYSAFILFSPTNQGVSLIIRSIPFFIALPLTESFDNFNTWRIAILLIVLKWGIEQNRILLFLRALRKKEYWDSVFETKKLEIYGSVFLFLSTLSLLIGLNAEETLLRIIYLFNIAAFFVVVRSLVSETPSFAKAFCRDFLIGVGMILAFGLVQFINAYTVEFWRFHWWWAGEVSLAQYGTNWSNVVLTDNTWFSYAGDTLRLRIFSVFPDTHSFPMYVIMGIPCFVTLLFLRKRLPFFAYQAKKASTFVLRSLADYSVFIGFVVAYLAVILSGTRGIWLASLAPLVLVLLWFHRGGKPYAKCVLYSCVLFVLLFGVYIGIVSFKQFQETESTSSATIERLQSVVDLSEKSNSGRLYIWENTIRYTIDHPIWGIGIANYPLILGEDIQTSIAGASAHNVYLHIASTTGVPSLIFAFLFLYELLRRGLRSLHSFSTRWEVVYQMGTVFALLWLAFYLMTDAVLFDERILLGFMVITGIAAGLYASLHKQRSLSMK